MNDVNNLVYNTSGVSLQWFHVNIMASQIKENTKAPGPRLNIKTIFPRYGDSHVKDKTVGETVLSLTWESLYW